MILSIFVLTGCSSQAPFTLSGTYFLDDPTMLGVGEIDEISTYNVAFKANENASVSLTLASGTYTTHLFTSEYNGTRCYEYTTTLKTSGSYVIDEDATDFEDTVETVCFFLGVDNNLKPLYSKRTVNAHSLVSKDNSYVAEYYDYVIETVYGKSSATVIFTPDKEVSTGSYSLEVGEHPFSKVFENTYFDNEMMLIAMRTMDLNSTFSATFKTIDSLSNAVRELSLSPDSDPAEKLEISYVNSGEKINNIDTFKYNLKLTGTFTGSSIILNYASRTNEKEGQRLVKMQVEAPLSLGTFTYTITNVTKK